MTFPSGWPEGVGLRQHDLLDSTNQEALRLAAQGERGPLWIKAKRQSAGRGRLGRIWVSEEGNLFATLMIGAVSVTSAQIGFVAGICATDVIARYVGGHTVRIKWPNDILAGRRKIAGILVEHVHDSLVGIGIGINIATSPSEVHATSIGELSGLAPNPDEVLTVVATEMKKWIGIWRDRGFGAIRSEWIARAAGIGEHVQTVTGQMRLKGIFENLDEDGALVLRDSGGASHRITAADVYYGG